MEGLGTDTVVPSSSRDLALQLPWKEETSGFLAISVEDSEKDTPLVGIGTGRSWLCSCGSAVVAAPGGSSCCDRVLAFIVEGSLSRNELSSFSILAGRLHENSDAS